MVRIWLNHWFSTAYNIINLIKQDEPDFVVIGSNEHLYAPYKNVCDEWYTEPVLGEEEYVRFCLDFCREHRIDVFLPRRGMLAVSRNKALFEQAGVKVLVDDYDKILPLNQKSKAYELFRKYNIGNVPDYYVVTDAEQFENAYNTLKKDYQSICFKFEQDEGGKSFRLIDNSRKGYKALFKKQNTRITFDDALSALSEVEKTEPVIVMPYLPDEEISIDCLRTSGGNIMIPRIKDNTRTEYIKYDEKILADCNEILEKIQLECPCNVQFKYLNNVPYLLEVNTRMSGGVQMSCLAAEINIPDIAVNKLIGKAKAWNINKTEQKLSHVEVPLIVY